MEKKTPCNVVTTAKCYIIFKAIFDRLKQNVLSSLNTFLSLHYKRISFKLQINILWHLISIVPIHISQ